jgi:hypothetical protein
VRTSTPQTWLATFLKAALRFETVMGGEPHVIRYRDNHIGDHTAFEAAHPVRQDLGRNPTDGLKASGIIASVVEAFSSAAKRTNRHREYASTAQNTIKPGAASAQSIARYSPGDHAAGRR